MKKSKIKIINILLIACIHLITDVNCFVVHTFGTISTFDRRHHGYNHMCQYWMKREKLSESAINSQAQVNAISEFASHVSQSLLQSREVLSVKPKNIEEEKVAAEETENILVSFTLNGPKAPRRTKNMNDVQKKKVEEQKNQLLGRMKEVKGRLISLRDKKKTRGGHNNNPEKLYLQVTIKFFGATDLARNWELDTNIEQKLIELITQGGDSSSKSEWGEVGNTDTIFDSAELELTNGTWRLDLKQQNAKCIFKAGKINDTGTKTKEKISEALLSHDKPKNFLLSPSALFFQRLGLTDSDGKPKQAKSSKLRQCQKFVEVVSGLVKESIILSPCTEKSKESPISQRPIITHDMGCGRGYLTFALHSHLYNIYNQEFNVQSLGVDMRPKLVKEINSIASELGSEFEGLHFETGTIENIDTNSHIDILIALHACDTATDDSLFYGIQKQASIIVTAPCCHKEVRKHLNAHVTEMSNDHPYADVLRYNIYKERIAETVTDSMRALLLEISDYNVQVFEFIGGEHTNKNVMITATKRKIPRPTKMKHELRSRLQSLAQLHGVHSQKLARLMNEPLYEHSSPIENARNIAKTGMPPL